MAKSQETYQTPPYECSNCNWSGSVEVAKGTPCPAKAKCPKCGCETATKRPVGVAVTPAYPYPWYTQWTQPTPLPDLPEPRISEPLPWPVSPWEKTKIWCETTTTTTTEMPKAIHRIPLSGELGSSHCIIN